MGISSSAVALLLTAQSIGCKFGDAATLGKQSFWPSRRGLDVLLPAFGCDWKSDDLMNAVSGDGSRFLKLLGADNVTEFDASAYEGASVVHDMNVPVPDPWKGRFDLLYDGGSIEHIFDTRQVIQNITDLIRVGGVFVGVTTANNLLGHGFYQFSPELFYRVFCRHNGWDTVCVLLCEHQAHPPRFWSVTDPELLGHRIELQNAEQLYLMIITKKVAQVEFVPPQQSDYSAAWGQTDRPAHRPTTPRSWRFLIQEIDRRWQALFSSSRRAEAPSRRAQGLTQEGIRRLSYQDMRKGAF